MVAKRFRLAVLWLLVVLFLGTGYFGPKQTQQQIVPALRTLAPWMAGSGVDAIHSLLRKLSHLTEYAVLALVWLRAFRAQERFTLKGASWAALAVCLVCAIADETHQARVPGRHGSVRDITLDSLGAVAMLIVVRSRKQVTDAAAALDTSDGRLTTVPLDKSA
jgi:VanZ family protein